MTKIFGANRCLTIKTKKEMKKILFMVAAVASMVFTACNKEDFIGGVDAPAGTVEFVAGFAVNTKTVLDAANKKTLWLETDAIDINGEKFVVKELFDNGASATFVNENDLSADFAAPFTATYPYGSNGVPAEQTAFEGNFDQSAVIEVATSDNAILEFKNASSLLKFQVAVACSEVKVSANENLANSSKTVTIKGDFVSGKDYYVAVLPGKKTNFAVCLDDYCSKSVASVNIGVSTIADMNTLPEPLRKVYVKNDLNWSDLSLYVWGEGDINAGAWPGTKLTTTENVGGNSYYVYDLKGKAFAPTGIIVNGKATKSGSTKVLVQTSNITEGLTGNKYYRLSMRENYYKEVDPNDLNTFGFRIYVYIQKGDNHVDPYLHIWDTKGITATTWNNQLKMTQNWTYPETGGKTFYYYEPPTSAYNSMNFIVTLNNGTKQTGDIKGPLKNDYYVCAWADSGTNCGLYVNSINNNSITASNIIKNNPENCK